MRPQGRKSAPKVLDGKVQKKNNHTLTYRPWIHNVGMPEIVKQRAPEGYRHLLSVADVQTFIEILPHWDELAVGLKSVVLSEVTDCMGWCIRGSVAVCPWEREMWLEWSRPFYEEHKPTCDLLDVEVIEKHEENEVYFELKFTENQAKGFQLLHVLLHELGHHHDRMLHPNRRCNHGEPYAEAYANKYMAIIWPEYVKRFPVY